jgi:type I restriction enzyme, R subunit
LSQKEAYSRVVIDRKLREAGWDIEDHNQVVFEDHGSVGRADYVLKDSSGKALALIEAKSPDIDPYSAKKQAHDYVQLQYPNVDYIYLANDHITYFWDIAAGDAAPVSAFFSQNDLERKSQAGRTGSTEPLARKAVDVDYFEDVADGFQLRPHQLEAWDAISHNYDDGKRSFLLEMATGTGKTVLASLVISKFLRTNNASNVLFIVDRKSLAIQTKGAFERLLKGVSATGTYWGNNRKNLTGSNVVVATIQSLMLHGSRDFSPGYFDLIIHDEAHRSIYTPEARAAVDHFIGATKIGLTATPKDFLKNIDIEKLGFDDPRALERRMQRDTYKYFDCENGVPTYRLTIQEAVSQGILVPPRQHKMNTVLTQAALSDEGLRELDDVELEEGSSLKIRDLEKKVYLPQRNHAMMEEFLHYAEKMPDGQLGKTIVFAVSQRHALELEKILNKIKPEYNGRFAQTITSNIQKAHELAKDFAKDTIQLPRIAITVDMLSTGFDAPEVLNLVLVRPIFDPTTYQQIKGRGTRLCPEIDKDHFTIFDFCGVVEYFNEEYDWEAPLPEPTDKVKGSPGPTPTLGPPPEPGPPQGPTEVPTSATKDVVSSRDQITVGPDGDVVDRNMYQDEWTKAVHSFVTKNKGHIDELLADPDRAEELIEKVNAELLNKPEHYFNEESLRQSYRIVAGVRDFFLAALGKTKLPGREEQLEELKQGLLSKFGAKEGMGSQRRSLMVEYLTDQLVQDEEALASIRTQPNLRFLAGQNYQQGFTTSEWLGEFDQEELLELAHDIADSKLLKV